MTVNYAPTYVPATVNNAQQSEALEKGSESTECHRSYLLEASSWTRAWWLAITTAGPSRPSPGCPGLENRPLGKTENQHSSDQSTELTTLFWVHLQWGQRSYTLKEITDVQASASGTSQGLLHHGL